jgi:hypothetical protein
MVNEATEALLEADDEIWQGDLNEGIAVPKRTEERAVLKVSRSTGTVRSIESR